MSKGSRQRRSQVSDTVVASNWDTIFGKKEKDMQVRVKENVEDIGKCGCGRSPTGKCIGWHGLTEDAYKEALEKYQTNQQDTDGSTV
jgi:hypothetical protein